MGSHAVKFHTDALIGMLYIEEAGWQRGRFTVGPRVAEH